MNNLESRRIDLIVKLLNRINRSYNDTECSINVQEAVRSLVSEIYCNTKFDPDILLDILTEDGWSHEDIRYFGFTDIFENEEQKG